MNRTDWLLLGRWADQTHSLIFRLDGSCELDGQACQWALEGYSILLDGQVGLKLPNDNAVTARRLTLRDVRAGSTALILDRAEDPPLAPLPE